MPSETMPNMERNIQPTTRLYSVGFLCGRFQVSLPVLRQMMNVIGIEPTFSINDIDYLDLPAVDQLQKFAADSRSEVSQ